MTAPAVGVRRDALRPVFDAAPECLRSIEDHFDVRVAQRIDDDSFWRA